MLTENSNKQRSWNLGTNLCLSCFSLVAFYQLFNLKKLVIPIFLILMFTLFTVNDVNSQASISSENVTLYNELAVELEEMLRKNPENDSLSWSLYSVLERIALAETRNDWLRKFDVPVQDPVQLPEGSVKVLARIIPDDTLVGWSVENSKILIQTADGRAQIFDSLGQRIVNRDLDLKYLFIPSETKRDYYGDTSDTLWKFGVDFWSVDSFPSAHGYYIYPDDDESDNRWDLINLDESGRYLCVFRIEFSEYHGDNAFAKILARIKNWIRSLLGGGSHLEIYNLESGELLLTYRFFGTPGKVSVNESGTTVAFQPWSYGEHQIDIIDVQSSELIKQEMLPSFGFPTIFIGDSLYVVMDHLMFTYCNDPDSGYRRVAVDRVKFKTDCLRRAVAYSPDGNVAGVSVFGEQANSTCGPVRFLSDSTLIRQVRKTLRKLSNLGNSFVRPFPSGKKFLFGKKNLICIADWEQGCIGLYLWPNPDGFQLNGSLIPLTENKFAQLLSRDEIVIYEWNVDCKSSP